MALGPTASARTCGLGQRSGCARTTASGRSCTSITRCRSTWTALTVLPSTFSPEIEDQTLNKQAADLAARYGIPGGAGSDAHDPEGIGRVPSEAKRGDRMPTAPAQRG